MTITAVKQQDIADMKTAYIAPETVITTDNGKPVTVPVWEQAMDKPTQSSIDRVLDYLISHGLRPRIQASGDVLTVATKIIQDMQSQIPASIHADLNVMLDHLLLWLCDYAEHTGVKTMQIRFGFENGQVNR